MANDGRVVQFAEISVLAGARTRKGRAGRRRIRPYQPALRAIRVFNTNPPRKIRRRDGWSRPGSGLPGSPGRVSDQGEGERGFQPPLARVI